MAPSSDFSDAELSEFDLIETYFAPLAGAEGLDLKDDAACIKLEEGSELIVTSDTLVSDIHFFADDKPKDIGFKAVSVNVSDLAAKGARPRYYLLNLSLPFKFANKTWLESFVKGLAEAQNQYNIKLVGGDTTRSPGPLTLSITAMGSVPAGKMIKRSGASAGDDLYVSGTIGDAALALKSKMERLQASKEILQRLARPEARPELGQALVGIATASADISDGLLADIEHICKASSLGGNVIETKIPLSNEVRALVDAAPALWPTIWSGGDDYEIVFTAAPKSRATLSAVAQKIGVPLTRIGSLHNGSSLELVDSNGKLVQVGLLGYKHF